MWKLNYCLKVIYLERHFNLSYCQGSRVFLEGSHCTLTVVLESSSTWYLNFFLPSTELWANNSRHQALKFLTTAACYCIINAHVFLNYCWLKRLKLNMKINTLTVSQTVDASLHSGTSFRWASESEYRQKSSCHSILNVGSCSYIDLERKFTSFTLFSVAMAIIFLLSVHISVLTVCVRTATSWGSLSRDFFKGILKLKNFMSYELKAGNTIYFGQK